MLILFGDTQNKSTTTNSKDTTQYKQTSGQIVWSHSTSKQRYSYSVDYLQTQFRRGKGTMSWEPERLRAAGTGIPFYSIFSTLGRG